MNERYRIEISVEARYVPTQSDPDDERYVFAYTILIKNTGITPAKLLERHWIITDANDKVREVQGLGVVGEQPHLLPGESFQYTSAAMIETSYGYMRGNYAMVADDGTEFNAEIPAFSLSLPHTLH